MKTVFSILPRIVILRCLFVLVFIAGPGTLVANAATYYIGPFSGSTPADDANCGIGKGALLGAHPCATLPYWNEARRSILKPGDVVRLAPATYRDTGPAAGTGYHCVLLDRFAKGVTYEGRTAADGPLDDHESVVVDSTGVSTGSFAGTNRCQARSINAVGSCNTDDYSDSTVRDIKFTNAPWGGSKLCGRSPGSVSSGITFDRIRITNTGTNGGIVIGSFNNSSDGTDSDCKKGGRTVKDVTIVDSEIDHVKGFPGGIQVGCMNGFNISRNSIHDICDNGDCTNCRASDPGCNDRDGIIGSGGINGIIAENEVYNVGEDGIDMGGHPGGKTHHITIERNAVHDVAKGNILASGGRYLVIRNNITWGGGNGYHSYSGARFVKVYNNTFWNGAFMWNYQESSEFVNNIISKGTTGGPTVFIDPASTNSTNTWKNNIVLNRTGGFGMGEDGGQSFSVPGCNGWNVAHTSYDVSKDLSIGFRPPPTPCPLGTRASPIDLAATPAGLTIFQANGAAGQWFGPGSGLNDKWGVAPTFVNSASPNAANLHLQAGDTVARGAGAVISVPGICGGITPGRCSDGLYGYPCSRNTDCNYDAQDYDGDSRAAAGWDIGADQVSTESHPPVLLSVEPQP